METNLTALKEKFEGLFTKEQHEALDVMVTLNERKAERGCGSITISIKPKEEKRSGVSASLYIVERPKPDAVIKNVMFVNNRTNDIIFNNTSPNAIDKSEKYIVQFVSKAAERMVATKETPAE